MHAEYSVFIAVNSRIALFQYLEHAMTRVSNIIRSSARSALLASVALGALSLSSFDMALAQGNNQGGNSESTGGSGQGAGGGGQDGGGAGQGAGGGGQADGDHDDGGAGQGGGGQDGDSDSGRPEDKGGRPEGVGGGDEDSDRPDWAGTPGGSAGRGSPPDAGGGGDLFGDMYVILRDDQGAPILSDAGFVQPLAEDGSLIPLDGEGHVLDESLTQEVEIGRLNVSRAPEDVLEGRSEEVIDLLSRAEALSFDPAGRLVITIEGVERTIDSPLENLSIYVALMETGTIEGVDNPILDGFFLVDGQKTAEDLTAAASFLAAATDKTGVFTTDEIAYVNLILDIETATVEGSDVAYSAVDFSQFTYDRADTYEGITTTILVPREDGSWVPEEINVYETIFDGTNDTVDNGTLGTFTVAADDARVVINYIHEYEVPVLPENL